MTELTEAQTIQLITIIVMQHNCRIVEMDLDNCILDIDGSPEDRVKCAADLELFLD